MKNFLYIALILLASCDNKPKTQTGDPLPDEPMTGSLLLDSFLTFQFKMDFKNPAISNNTDRQIDLLFNGMKHFLSGHRHHGINFRTECMPCEPVQEYRGGLLFAKRILIEKEQIKYYKSDFDIPDSLNRIKLHSDYGGRTNKKFQFSKGKGNIKYSGMSCNDADHNQVRLSYPTGEIIIDSLVNASFFEYDLDKNGQIEQYLLGSRSCSQEFVLLRIRKRDEMK